MGSAWGWCGPVSDWLAGYLADVREQDQYLLRDPVTREQQLTRANYAVWLDVRLQRNARLDVTTVEDPEMCWAYGHETVDEPVCIHCGKPVVGA